MNIYDIANSAAEHDVTSGVGGFTRDLPRPGAALLRLQSYIELGLRPAKNPTHKPQRQVRLRFELLHPDHMITGTKQDGTAYRFPDTLDIRVNIAGPTSRFGKLFSKMNYDKSAEFMYQLIGKPFLGKIFHNVVGEGKDAKTYVNLDYEGEWHIGAPVVEDPLTNESKPINVPELQGDPQMFLYNKEGLTEDAVKFMWDSIYIDGETTEGKSKNWIQNTIRESIDFAGSITQRVADGQSLDLNTDDMSMGSQQPVLKTDELAALNI